MDYKNVTFKQLFVTSFMLVMPVSLWVIPRVMTQYSEKNQIISLLLMGLYALIYVVLLYIAFTKGIATGKKRTATIIYIIRFAIRTVIIMYFFVKGCRTLMLPDCSDFLIAVVLFASFIYIAGKGIKGFICFSEVTFIGVAIALIFFVACSFKNADFSRLSGYIEIEKETSVCNTICQTMSKGFLLLASICMLEFVMLMYLNIKGRRRGMLVGSVTAPFLFSVLAAIFVIALLGEGYPGLGNKSILNIVGAMVLPGGSNARLGILSCYLFVMFGVMLMGIHVIFICQMIKGLTNIKNTATANASGSLLFRSLVMLALFVLYTLVRLLFERTNLENAVIIYIATIDIPLSVLVPALLNRNKSHPEKYAAKIVAGILALCLLTGCEDRAIESVDYLRVLFIEGTENGAKLTLVTDSLEGAESADESEENIYSIKADSLKKACDRYDFEHERKVDLSHVEYIVVDSYETLSEFYPELVGSFVTNYVEVLCDDNLYVGDGDGSIREYISNHYEGECLATIDLIYD